MKTHFLGEKTKQFMGGAFISYLTIGFNIISGLLYTPWMIQTLGNDQYALYTLAISVINLFLIDFGIGAAVSKFLSSYYADQEYEEANCFLGIVYKVFLVISAFIAILLLTFYFFIDRIYVKLTPDELIVFKNLFIIVSLYSVFSFPFTTFNSVLMANERFVEVKLCGLLSKVLSVALIIICLVCNLGIYSFVLVHAFVNFGVIAVKYWLIKHKTRQKVDFKKWDSGLSKSLFSFSAWITLKDLAQRCIFTLMPTIIAATIGSKEITMFSIAVTLEGYVFTFADAINGMFLPRISKVLREDDALNQVHTLLEKVSKFHVYTIGLIFVGFLCIGDTFINVWMGDGYDVVYNCAILLIFPSLIDVPQQIAKTALLASNVIKQQSIIYVAMAIINVALAVVLLNYCGIVGAAFSVCIAYLFRTACMNFLYKKYLFIDIKKYFASTYGRWIICAILTIVAEKTLSRYLRLSGLIEIVSMGLTIVVTYTLLYGLICIGPNKVNKVICSKIKK